MSDSWNISGKNCSSGRKISCVNRGKPSPISRPTPKIIPTWPIAPHRKPTGRWSYAPAIASKLIAKIDDALRRIDDGSYGYCEETGEPITLARLEARPIATLSLEAQERHERRERVHRDD